MAITTHLESTTPIFEMVGMPETSDLTVKLAPGGGWSLTDGVVTLVPMTKSHLGAVMAAAGDAKCRRMLAHAVDLSGDTASRRQNLFDYLLSFGAAGKEPFAVTVPDRRSTRGATRVIGVRWLVVPWSRHAPVFSCGGWISAHERRKGYGSRALRLACAYAESVHGAVAVETATRVDNHAAQANLAAAGFHRATEADEKYRRSQFGRQPSFLESWIRIAGERVEPRLCSDRN